MANIKYEVHKDLGTLTNNSTWNKYVRLVSWSGAAPKIDVRVWNDELDTPAKGIALYDDEANTPYKGSVRILFRNLDEPLGWGENLTSGYFYFFTDEGKEYSVGIEEAVDKAFDHVR